MNKYILIMTAFFSFNLQAEVITDLKNCTKIEDDTKRLKCFDAVTGYYGNSTLNQHSSAEIPNKQHLLSNSNKTPQLDNNDTIVLSKEDSFGKSVSQLTEQESITTHIIGDFKGWKKDAILKLANNQTWKVISGTKGYVNLKNPKVVISRGFWGSFDMKVEQLNAKAKVKRID